MQIDASPLSAVPKDGIFNVRDFGATGDGITKDTAYLQAAIRACAHAGGGTVLLPPGKYLSGTLVLESHITLHLSTGATLVGSKDIADFSFMLMKFRDAVGTDRGHALIFAHQKEHFKIEGDGIIDGQGAGYQNPRPMILRFIDCQHVTVTGITLKNSPSWVQHYLGCEDLIIRGVRVDSHCNGNNDGINLDGCARVIVSDCHFSSADDAFTLKCTTDRPCRDIAVSNCLFKSDCNAIKFGTESIGGFENVTISNCVVYDTRLCGITVASVDGALLQDVIISNITMRNVGGAIFVRLGSRGYHLAEHVAPRPVGLVRRLVLRDIQANGVDRIGSAIIGMPGHPIEDVTLENLHIRSEGGGTREEAARIWQETPACYPQYNNWGVFPAYGLYCRHIQGLHVRNLRFEALGSDARPALLCEDIHESSHEAAIVKTPREANGNRFPAPFSDAEVSFETNGHLI